MKRDYYTDESWQKVLDAQNKGRETSTRQAELRRDVYYKNPKLCRNCTKPILYEKRKDYDFCNSSCSAIASNKLRKKHDDVFCESCGKVLSNVRGRFCNATCQSDFNYSLFIKEWISGRKLKKNSDFYIRRYLFDLHDNKCELCGWGRIHTVSGVIPLHVHHKDGDSNNNCIENLQLLCPNCHSLTENYGIYNKGKGRRKYRELYWKEKNLTPIS